jgi:membrane-bound serine protease (ClpP class)
VKAILLLFFISSPFLLPAQKVVSITIDGTINPASASYIERSIQKSAKQNAQCLIINLNTPGGLLKSTRVIVGAILDAPIPIVVYVSPGGAHAGSAGVFITLAAHVAAMAPGTNIGAAHPVSEGQMDTTMNEKLTNDAAAFVRTIAEKRSRNIVWAEEAVRKSVSLTGSEAVQQKVVDLLATDTRQLLEQIDGRTVNLSTGSATLHTRSASIEQLDMSFSEKVLNIISDPNLAYMLLMLGFYGLLFELYNPGAIFPGIAGVIGLVLGLYALHTLPVNYAGLALMIFGIILFLLEIKITSHGLLTIGGIVSLLLGSLMLIRDDTAFPILKISTTVILSTTAITALFFLFVVGAGIRAQRAKPVTGLEAFIGETGIVLEPLDPLGNVRVHGEIWQALSETGRIEAGEKIRVLSMKNFRLTVEPLQTT